MKKSFIVIFAFSGMVLISCGNNANQPAAPMDSVKAGTSNSIDSAANNSILPPSAAPGNATNSSLADTTYKAKDSSKKRNK